MLSRRIVMRDGYRPLQVPTIGALVRPERRNRIDPRGPHGRADTRHDNDDAFEQGDSGVDVAGVQKSLGLPIDGEFGPVTKAGVKGFQGACGLARDGVVGPNTWAALDALDARKAAGGDDQILAVMAQARER